MKKKLSILCCIVSISLFIGLSIHVWSLSIKLSESRLNLEKYVKYEGILLLNASNYILSNDPYGMFQEILSADDRYALTLTISEEELCDVAREIKDKRIIELLNVSKLRHHRRYITCFLLVD